MKKLASALEILSRLEWSVWDHGYKKCPICYQAAKYGHHEDCELKALLNSADRSPEPATLDAVIRDLGSSKASALSTPWRAEEGFVFSATGVRVADCHCDDQPETEGNESAIASIIAHAVSRTFPGPPDTSPPPEIAEGFGKNFETMLLAAADGKLALVSARYNSGRPAVLVCAMQTNPDRTISPVPFAVMVDGNPFEMFQDPNTDAQ